MRRVQCVLELAGFVHGFVDECLDDRLAERREFAAAEAADEALHSGKADAIDLMRLFVQDDHPAFVQDPGDLLGLAAFVIVVAEDSQDGNCALTDILGEDLGFFRSPEIGEVPAQDQHVRGGGNFLEQLPVGSDAVFDDMEVADCCNFHVTCSLYCSSRLPTGSANPHSVTSVR